MPAFFHAEFWDFANAELWVGVGLLIFLCIVIFVAKAPKAVAGALDAKSAKIQADLDEAAKIRAEAEAMLKDLKVQRAAAEAQAAAMLANAKEEAKRLEAEAKAKLEEQVARRTALAERRISTAEAQAMTEVKAAAVDMASAAAQSVLAARAAASKADPLVDAAIGQLGAKLQ